MSIEEIKLPDVGGEEVEIIEICVSEGENLEEDQAIIVVETEKASMDIPVPYNCIVKMISVKIGDKISQGSVICSVEQTDSNGQKDDFVSSNESLEIMNKVKDTENCNLKAVETNTSSHVIASSLEDIFVPDLDSDEAVDVIEIIANVGDVVAFEFGIITLETEKATIDIPAPFGGVLREILVKVGDKVKTGDLIARMQKDTVVSTLKEIVKEETISNITNTNNDKIKQNSNQEKLVKPIGKIYAGPSVRRFAREYGVDLSKVIGSGKKGRISKENVRLYIKNKLLKCNIRNENANTNSGLNLELPPLKDVDFSKFGETHTIELNKIQKISGPSLHRNWVSIPHITQFDDVDITELEKFRKEQNAFYVKTNNEIKISPLVFAIKAVSKALILHPNFNSSLSSDKQSVIYKKYVNIAIAIDTPNGLVVPVIKDADKKGFEQIANELKELSIKAREGKLKITDMQGACFTISSLGGIGGTFFTPIINAPEVAILGLSKTQIKPIFNGKDFEPRLILPLSLSYDHRVIDGADGARFITTLSKILSDIRLLLL